MTSWKYSKNWQLEKPKRLEEWQRVEALNLPQLLFQKKKKEEGKKTYLGQKIIPVGERARKGEPFFVDFTTSKCVIISANKGRGKTMLARRLSDYLKYHYIMLFLSDVKRDMETSVNPDTKYIHPDFEKPEAIPNLKFFQPFFTMKYGKIRGDVLFSLKLRDFSEAEFFKLCGIHYSHANNALVARTVFNILQSKPNEKLYQLLKSIYDHPENYNLAGVTGNVRSIINRIFLSMSEGIVEGKYVQSYKNLITTDFNSFNHAVIDWSALPFSELARGKTTMDIYLSFLINKFHEWRKAYLQGYTREKCPPLLLVFEEAANLSNPSLLTSSAIEYVFTQGRQQGISSIFITQFLKNVPTSLMQNADYFFIAAPTDRSEALTLKQAFPKIFTDLVLMEKFYAMDTHEFLFIDRRNNVVNLVPYPSLSEHKEEFNTWKIG